MSPNGSAQDRRRVVIVGGGFGGMEAARRLKRANVDVTVVDRHNHLLFQPLIYQVAAGALSAGEVAAPHRHMLKRHSNATVVMASVTDVDVVQRQVVLDRGERIDYDNLIVACGGETSYFGHDGWKQVTCGLKTLADAVTLRDRIFSAFEEAERTTDAAVRDEWLTFVVVVFFVLLILFRILAFLDECIWMTWEQRSRRFSTGSGDGSEHHRHRSRHHGHSGSHHDR